MVHFLEEVLAGKFAFDFYWPLVDSLDRQLKPYLEFLTFSNELLKKQQADKNIIDILNKFYVWGIFMEQNRNDDDTMVIWARVAAIIKKF